MVNKLTIGQVIYIDFPSKSFKWANGLKIIASISECTIDVIDLDDNGNLSLFDNGKYMLSTTGINNTGIRVIEGLTYKINKQLLLIETAFEGYSDFQGYSITTINEEKENFDYYEGNSRYANNEKLTFEEAYNCTMLFRKYEHRERLIAICNNIIKNNGIFIP